MMKPVSPEVVKFLVNHEELFSCDESGTFKDKRGNVLSKNETFFVFCKWIKEYGKYNLGWEDVDEESRKCDCGALKANTTHSHWCSAHEGQTK